VVLWDSGPFTLSAGVGEKVEVLNLNQQVYCRFVNVSKSKVRAALTTFVSTDDGSDQLVVPAQ
jgi:hypothetical protein